MLRRAYDDVTMHIRTNMALYLAVLFFFVIGVTAGIFTISALPREQMSELTYFLDSFFNIVKAQTPDIGAVLLQSLLNNFKLLLLIALCGLTVFMTPFMLILMSVKGFMLGFTVSAMILQFGVLGVMVSLVCILPPNAVIVWCYLRLGVDSCLNGIRNRRQRKWFKGRAALPRLDKDYLNLVFRLSLFCIIGVIMESVMAPFVLRLFAGAIG
ncbi:stage II sporulation protein M [Clostridia bacterium OttesenSCG-928-F22]|nr:stage II sporulation protein M [Clostridia bacterium OttesenSCG-928-F22]